MSAIDSRNGREFGGRGKGPLHVLEMIGNAGTGGVESYVANLIQALTGADEARFTVMAPHESAYTAHLRRLGCSIVITPIRDDPPWRSIETAVQLVRQERVDVIHANLLNAHTLASIVGGLTGVPACATVHSMYLASQELSVCHTTGAHMVLVCQTAYARALAAGLARESLSLIPNGVDLKRFAPNRDGSAFRASIGVPHDAPLVGFVGRISIEKGPDKFVQIAERINRVMPDVHFAMVGEGPWESHIREMIERLRIGDRVHLTGMREDTEAVYPALDLFIQPSRADAMPLSVIEAMACGLPVVAMAIGGIPELVEFGTTGYVATLGEDPGAPGPYPGDWEALANFSLDLLRQPERMKVMGAAGRTRAEELFDLTLTARRTGELFRRLAQTGGKGLGAIDIADIRESRGRARVKPDVVAPAKVEGGLAALSSGKAT